MSSLRTTLRSIRASYARRGHAVTDVGGCRDEIRTLLMSQAYQRWDAPLRDIVHALARHFAVTNPQTMAHDHGALKCIFDMDREHVPAFLDTRLRIGEALAAKWCDLIWFDRIKEMQ